MSLLDERCGQVCPDDAGLVCEKEPHPWGSHYSRTGNRAWPGLPMPSRSRRGSAGRVIAIITAIEKYGATTRTGPPEVAVESWESRQRRWLTQAKAVLREVCESQDTFTTEEVWKRVPDTTQRRAMVQVVRHGIARGWLHEESATRIKGEWATADGHRFPLNKLVPVYRSDLR